MAVMVKNSPQKYAALVALAVGAFVIGYVALRMAAARGGADDDGDDGVKPVRYCA
jgi:hypothetical protein